MNCPYCNKEMKKGIITSPQNSFDFISDEARNQSYFFPERINLKRVLDSDLVAYYCDACHKIVIDVK
ncbi:PF20097 family protein [Clostridium sp. 1001275B_160808_H3]|uniref:PF20097 family protein n=1 Tax=Clostridium sp. 1001275B_160808_H3 TaxID=2787110 RepID=UPI00189924F4|nr:PF20097 family protein [Clostridium sp. 1001275B_160808_H3]